MFISDTVFYAGVNDRKVDLFEGQYPVPNGISYNSYIIKCEKVAVMDSVDKNFGEEWLENIEKVLGDKAPDYLVVLHMEPDHSANIKAFLEKYPDANIYCLDSLRFGPSFGLLAIYASMLRSEGKSLEETVAWLEANKQRFHQAGWLDDLSFVAKKGRLTHAKAFFGTLAGIKPIGEIDSTGMTTVLGKVKGAKNAFSVLLSYIAEVGEDLGDQIVVIAQSDRLAQAEQYKKMLEEKFSPKEIHIMDLYPSSGINVGPGLMAAYFMGKPVTEDLKYERELIENLIKEAEGK